MSQVLLRKLEEMPRSFKTLDELKPAGKRVVVRADLNVPMKQGRVQDATRISRVMPTLKELLQQKARVIVISHFDRPNGKYEPSMSLAPLVDELAIQLKQEVKFAPDCIGQVAVSASETLKDGEILLLENLRFHAGEEENSPQFISELAKLGEVYVNDAFSCSHRAHASVTGLAERMDAYAGRLMQDELDALETTLENPARPMTAVIGGAKVSSKLKLLENLIGKVDHLIIGGGMANTFLYAMGHDIGKSLCERNMKKMALDIIDAAKKKGCEIVLPVDAVCAEVLEARTPCEVVDINHIPTDKMILDIGPKSLLKFQEALEKSKTVLWNGPMGAFETSPFDAGTVMLARSVSMLTSSGKVRSIAGGGDTVSALASAGVAGNITYLSTAGGAFLEWLEGETLPGVKALCS